MTVQNAPHNQRKPQQLYNADHTTKRPKRPQKSRTETAHQIKMKCNPHGDHTKISTRHGTWFEPRTHRSRFPAIFTTR